LNDSLFCIFAFFWLTQSALEEGWDLNDSLFYIFAFFWFRQVALEEGWDSDTA
jgi:hypothetical protein